MSFNQIENLQQAILKNKARSEEIRDQLSRSGGTAGSRLRLREQAIHSEQAAAELQVVVDRLAPPARKQDGKQACGLPYRAEWKRAIRAVLTEKPKAEYREVCEILDDRDTPLPPKWVTDDDPSLDFVSAYDDPRRRGSIKSAISKIRHDMRARGEL